MLKKAKTMVPGPNSVVVPYETLEAARDEVDRTITMIDELCQQRPHLVVLKAWFESQVGTRNGRPTKRPPPMPLKQRR